MRIDSEGLERLGASPLLSTLVELWSDGVSLHSDPGCTRAAAALEALVCSAADAFEHDQCFCLRTLRGSAPQVFADLFAAQAIWNALSRSGDPSPLGSSPRDVALAASRLARVEETLDELELVAPPGPLVKGILEQVTASVLEERDRLAELCAAARSSALVQVAARRVVDDVSTEAEDASLASPGLDPARVAMSVVAPWWFEHVVDGLAPVERRALVAKRLCSARPVLEWAALDVLDGRLAALVGAPDLVAVVHLPVRPPGEGLYRLVVDSCTEAEDGRLRLMLLPAYALAYLGQFRGTEVRSVASAPTDPVVLENALAMWSPDPGPLSQAHTLVAAAAAVQH